MGALAPLNGGGNLRPFALDQDAIPLHLGNIGVLLEIDRQHSVEDCSCPDLDLDHNSPFKRFRTQANGTLAKTCRPRLERR